MIYVILALAASAILFRPLRAWRIEARRRKRSLEPLPERWRRILDQRVPLYARLPADLKRRLEGHINVFLDEKRFHGRGGLEVTDVMRLTVAAQACLLTVNLRTKYYPGFTSILIYPDTYVAPQTERDGWLETTHGAVRAGESWSRGPVVLSWRDTLEDTENPADGSNVVLHEFAHKLDEQAGGMDGAPPLEPGQQASWAEVLTREYEALRRDAAAGPAVLDEYGATSPAEFFAVTTETFFERPVELREHHPELYTELARFYRLDPASW